MNKKTAVALMLCLCFVLVFFNTGSAFAADGEASADVAQKTTWDWIIACVTYGILALALIVGLPVLKKISKRTNTALSQQILFQTQQLQGQIHQAYEERNSKFSTRKVIRLGIQVSVLADKALSAYTERQIEGFSQVYSQLNAIKDDIALLDKKKADFEERFLAVEQGMENVLAQAQYLNEREEKIKKYNV